MAEYIEREALIQHMQECKDENAFTLMATGYAYSFIEAAPSADVVEVVHGEWECPCFDISDYWRCSACGEEWFFEYDPTEAETKVNYCPRCGAKMDGERRCEG